MALLSSQLQANAIQTQVAPQVVQATNNHSDTSSQKKASDHKTSQNATSLNKASNGSGKSSTNMQTKSQYKEGLTLEKAPTEGDR
jgi:hypothetical protein